MMAAVWQWDNEMFITVMWGSATQARQGGGRAGGLTDVYLGI